MDLITSLVRQFDNLNISTDKAERWEVKCAPDGAVFYAPLIQKEQLTLKHPVTQRTQTMDRVEAGLITSAYAAIYRADFTTYHKLHTHIENMPELKKAACIALLDE